MNLRETKALQCGDKFRRPSKNSHDNGWRVYAVVGRTVDASGIYGTPGAVLGFETKDQHGYINHVSITAWDSMGGESKNFMKVAERVIE